MDTERAMRQSENRSVPYVPPVRFLEIQNDDAQPIPPYGVCGIVEVNDDGSISVKRPTENSQASVLVNSGTAVAPGDFGQASMAYPLRAAYTGPDPLTDTVLGPVKDSWYLAQGQVGFRTLGDGSEGVVNVFLDPPGIRVKTITTDYVILLGDYLTVFDVDATSGPVGLTLPSSPPAGFLFWVRRKDSDTQNMGSVNGIGISGGTIDGGFTLDTPQSQYGVVGLLYLGAPSNLWTVLSTNTPPMELCQKSTKFPLKDTTTNPALNLDKATFDYDTGLKLTTTLNPYDCKTLVQLLEANGVILPSSMLGYQWGVLTDNTQTFTGAKYADSGLLVSPAGLGFYYPAVYPSNSSITTISGILRADSGSGFVYSTGPFECARFIVTSGNYSPTGTTGISWPYFTGSYQVASGGTLQASLQTFSANQYYTLQWTSQFFIGGVSQPIGTAFQTGYIVCQDGVASEDWTVGDVLHCGDIHFSEGGLGAPFSYIEITNEGTSAEAISFESAVSGGASAGIGLGSLAGLTINMLAVGSGPGIVINGTNTFSGNGGGGDTYIAGLCVTPGSGPTGDTGSYGG